MTYKIMTEADVGRIARLYMDYYNSHEDGCWTFEKARKRIHQMVTIEDSLCLMQLDDAGNTTGFAIGYFKEYDDLTSYWLEEIVILAEYQNKGYGRQFLSEIERRVQEHGAARAGAWSGAYGAFQRERRAPYALLHRLRHVPRRKSENYGKTL